MLAVHQEAAVGEASAVFEAFVRHLAGELVRQVTQEHGREVVAMFEEIVRLREQLHRASQMMESYVGRERHLHDMLEGLTSTYTQATVQMQQTHREFTERAQAVTLAHDDQRKQLVDPMQDTQAELLRIHQMLAAPPVLPAEAQRMQVAGASPEPALAAAAAAAAAAREPHWRQPPSCAATGYNGTPAGGCFGLPQGMPVHPCSAGSSVSCPPGGQFPGSVLSTPPPRGWPPPSPGPGQAAAHRHPQQPPWTAPGGCCAAAGGAGGAPPSAVQVIV